MTAQAAQTGFLLDALRDGDAGSAESAALLLLSGGLPLAALYDEVLVPFLTSARDDLARGGLRLVDEHVASRAAVELATLLGRRQLPWTTDGAVCSPGRGLVVL